MPIKPPDENSSRDAFRLGWRLSQTLWLLLLLPLASSMGCSRTESPQFKLNRVAINQDEREFKIEIGDERRQELTDILTAIFGTPDQPVAFPETGLDLAQLKWAAGPVARNQLTRTSGLYREHCSHCHGISGDGAGPTAAFLDPYPRGYRGTVTNPGAFKFKSTYRAAKPTDEDLKRILHDGIPGTAMPSFKLLPENEIEALVEYVKYLSIRGETELRLIRHIAENDELEATREFLVEDVLQSVGDAWQQAPSMVVVPPPPPEDLDLAKSIEHGRELFYGQTANCVKCHGNTALGDGQNTDLDDWLKNVQSDDVALGALPPRTTTPRNLRTGIYRGGRRPLDLYWRVFAGINGTPMPGLGAPDPGSKPTLDPQEMWDIVNYIRSLPYEDDAEPAPRHAAVPKERL